jgi:hypothetical protein
MTGPLVVVLFRDATHRLNLGVALLTVFFLADFTRLSKMCLLRAFRIDGEHRQQPFDIRPLTRGTGDDLRLAGLRGPDETLKPGAAASTRVLVNRHGGLVRRFLDHEDLTDERRIGSQV